MKKDEYKKSIDNIKIDSIEKAKIYENIQNGLKNKKTKMSWIPFASIGLVSAFAVVLFFAINGKGSTNGGNIIPNVVGENVNVVGGNVKLENSYSREIVTSAVEYMSTHNISVEDGKTLKIDASNIINDKKYNVCSGNLIVENENGVYKYSSDVKCNGQSNEKITKNYKLISNTANYQHIVDDGVIVVSDINKKYSEINEHVFIKNDLHFIKFNLNGEVEWEFDYTTHEKGESVIYVESINKIENNYVIEFSEESDFEVSKDGASSSKNNSFISAITIDGKMKNVISDFNGNSVYFVNKDGNDLYYGYSVYGYDKKSMKEFTKESMYKVSYKNGVFTTRIIDLKDVIPQTSTVEFVKGNDIYGSYDTNIVFKYNLQSKKYIEYNLSKKSYESMVRNIYSNDKYVYIEFMTSANNEDTKIIKLDKNLEFVKELAFGNTEVYINSLDESNLYLATYSTSEDKLITLSENDEEIDSYVIDLSDLNGYGYGRDLRQIENIIIQVYSIDGANDEQLLLVFDCVK